MLEREKESGVVAGKLEYRSGNRSVGASQMFSLIRRITVSKEQRRREM